MEQLSTDKKMNQMVFWPAIIALAAFIFYGVFFQESLGKLLNSLLYGMANGLGWFINLLSLASLLLALVVVIYKYGDIRIGGDMAKPKFKTFNWCAMSICSGIGTGLLF